MEAGLLCYTVGLLFLRGYSYIYSKNTINIMVYPFIEADS